jgi:hypothetical protein
MSDTVIIIYGIGIVAGGVIAVLKKDYFMRGFFICIFTGILGLIALLVSPKSKAKTGDETDEHSWPQYGGYAVLFIMFWIIILLFINLIL